MGGEMNSGDLDQMKIILNSMAEAAVARFAAEHPEIKRSDLPPVFKWLAGIAAVIVAAVIVNFFGDMQSSIRTMDNTLVRLDERLKSQAQAQEADYKEMDRRVTDLEALHGRRGGA